MITSLVKPIIAILTIPIANAIFSVLGTIGILFWTIFTFIISIFKFLVLDFPLFLFFDITLSDGFDAFRMPRTYYQFLIIAAVLWLIQFFIFVYRFSKEMDGEKSSFIYKNAFLASFKGVITLLFFQILVIFFCMIVYQITMMLATGSGTSNAMFEISNKIIVSFFPPDWKVIEPFSGIAAISPAAWAKSFFLWIPGDFVKRIIFQSLGQSSEGGGGSLVGIAFTSGLAILVSGILITLPLIMCLIETVGKIFLAWLLFMTYPLIPAFSINDNGKRMKIWKSKFIGYYMVGPVYLIALQFLGIFIGRINSFTNHLAHSKNFGLIYEYSLIAKTLFALLTVLLIVGAVWGFKKVNEVVVAFIGTEMEVDGAQKAAKLGKEQIDKHRSSVSGKKRDAKLSKSIGESVGKAINPVKI